MHISHCHGNDNDATLISISHTIKSPIYYLRIEGKEQQDDTFDT